MSTETTPTHTVDEDARAQLIAQLERRLEQLRKDVVVRDAKIAELTFSLEKARTYWIEALRTRAAGADARGGF
jgi:hypothetical protein